MSTNQSLITRAESGHLADQILADRKKLALHIASSYQTAHPRTSLQGILNLYSEVPYPTGNKVGRYNVRFNVGGVDYFAPADISPYGYPQKPRINLSAWRVVGCDWPTPINAVQAVVFGNLPMTIAWTINGSGVGHVTGVPVPPSPVSYVNF